MNYLEEQTDGEEIINSIKNSERPSLVVAQVSLAGTAPNAPPTLKDPKFWTAEEKKTRKIDQTILLKIYGMRGSEYGEQDRKAAILYKYETFRATEGEQLLDTYLLYLQVTNDMKKQTKNLLDINIDALYNILKQNQGDVNDANGYKKKDVMVTSDPLTMITALLAKTFNRKKYYSKPTNNNLRTSSASSSANKKPEYVKSEKKTEDKKKEKVKDYNYYKTKMLLAKKDTYEQVLLAEDQAWMESSSDSDQEINANVFFMAKMEKVLSYSEESSSSAKETIAKIV
uniref:Gag-Pol polyprotein n=1 Tax=Tanacetum cinerariifolium TaxID=118510 RepID=A0A6L2KTV2_TANCI|nr:hypothetical protein [Tanacetum cinerariifolium]